MGGWVDRKVEEDEAVRMSSYEPPRGWVGWVGGWETLPGCAALAPEGAFVPLHAHRIPKVRQLDVYVVIGFC